MHVIYTPAALFCLISMVLCLLTGMVLLIYSPRAANKTNLILGAFFITFGFTQGVIYLIFTKQIYYLPHLYRTGHFSWLLSIPLSYLYVRTTVEEKPLQWRDLVHLIPALLFLIDYAPFLFSSTGYKLLQIKADLSDLDFANSFRQGWLFPAHFHVPARTVVMVFYWLLQVRVLASLDKLTIRQNRTWFSWLFIFTMLQITPIGIAAISILTSSSYVWTTCIPPAAAALTSAVILYLHPQVLYGAHGIKKTPPPARQRATLDSAFITQKNMLLEKLMKESKPFLNSNYTLKELATDLHMPPYQASAFINQVTGRNFNDYLNFQRITYCLDFVKRGDAGNLNLYGISQKCGFNNRNTFTIAFKKVTGKSPSEYLTTLED